jgi:WD40 repeat protein
MESHNDDVTMVGFHPTDTNGLISGSTDGLVNLYNTSITDEDDALFQTVNHGASIHKAGFLSEKRLFALSHMETMAIYCVYDADEDKEEMSGKVDLGDLRGLLSCDYVADILSGYVAAGKDNELRLVPLANEQFQLDNAITLKGGHGEEVIRSLLLDATNSMVITGGEDGIVRYWRASIVNQEHTANDAKMDEDEGEQEAEKKQKHKHKHHHHHHTAGDDKHDKDRKRKKHKHKDKKDKKAGFKPY